MQERFFIRLMVALVVAAGLSTPVVAQQPQPQQTSPDTVIAEVNGSKITFSELQMAVEGLPPRFRDAPLNMLYEPLLKQLVERRLAAQAAEREGMLDDPEVKRRLSMARDQLLYQLYLRGVVEPAVTEEKMRARYEAGLENSAEEEVRARHILSETREQAEAVVAELQQGADFEAMAKERSIGPSGKQGGDLGFFKRGDMVPEFSEAAFALGAGEVSGPVQTQFGWHVIRVEERRQAIPPSFEESAQQLQSELAQEAVLAEMRELAAKADIKAYNPDGSARAVPEIGVAPEQ